MISGWFVSHALGLKGPKVFSLFQFLFLFLTEETEKQWEGLRVVRKSG